MDERFDEWIKELLSINSLHSVDELTPDMIYEEIQDAESSIDNERLWEMGSKGAASAMHRTNAANLRDYIQFLKALIPDEHKLTQPYANESNGDTAAQENEAFGGMRLQ